MARGKKVGGNDLDATQETIDSRYTLDASAPTEISGGEVILKAPETTQGFTDLGVLVMQPYNGVGVADAELETTPVEIDGGFPTVVKSSTAVKKLTGVKAQNQPIPNNDYLVHGVAQQVDIFKVYPSVSTPAHKTQASGCFDFEVYLGPEITTVRAFNYANREYALKVQDNDTGRYIAVPFGNRVLLPTGLVFAIPRGFALSLVARSSAGFKQGLQLSQGLGYVDEDYRDQVFLPITVTAHSAVRIDHKERIAQGYIHPWYRAEFNVLHEHPGLLTDRVGGFGSTNQ